MAATSRRISSTGPQRAARHQPRREADHQHEEGHRDREHRAYDMGGALHLAQGSRDEHEVHLVGRGGRFGDQDEVVAQPDRQVLDDAHLAGLHRRDRRLTLDVGARRHDSSSLIEDLDQRLVDIVDGEPVERRAGLHQ